MTVQELEKILTNLKKKKDGLEGTLKVLGNDLLAEKNSRKPNDAKIKSINAEIADTKKEINKIDSDIKLNNLYKTGLTKAVTIDSKLKNLYSQYTTAIARGESTASIEKQIDDLISDRKTALTSVSSYAPGYVPKFPIPEDWKKTTTTKKVTTTTKKTTVKVTTPTGETTGKTGGTTGATSEGTTAGTTKTPQTFEQIIGATEYWYSLPDYIFDQDEALKDILVQAVNEDWDADKFLSVVKNKSTWWNKNAGPIRERIIDLAKYNDLRSRGIDVSNTTYGRFLNSNINNIKNRSLELTGVALDDAAAQKVAEQVWNGFLDDDQNAIDKLILPYLGKVTTILGGKSTQTYGGEALKNYQMLQTIAYQNGFTLKDILPNISTATTGGDLEKAVLQKLATGELNVNTIAQAARSLAAQGQPQYVKDLLNQGYDLTQIFSPYRNIMASELEINPDEISLNDPVLRSAITEKGETNIYDFKKMLRKDSRWQYTESARNEVAGAVSSILSDFGFQG